MLTLKINDILELSKYTNILKSNIKVSTPNGLKKIYAVGVTAINSQIISLKTKKHELSCAPDHLVKSKKKWKKCKDFKIGDIVDTKYGESFVKEISLLDRKDDLIDIHVDGSEYYTNDILSHNSSLIQSFEYILFGKVLSNKKKKWATLSTLPNRINGELINRIKFKSGSIDVEVKRGINPNILELTENGIVNDRAGKSNLDDIIEGYVGVDIETFKSFISLSINDFKNFISLTNEEKQLLLDKLFNLEVINILNGILKELNKNNKLKLSSLDSEIRTLDESINSIQRSIDRSIEKEKENTQTEIEEIKGLIESKKIEYSELKIKIEKIKEKEKELNNNLEEEKKQQIITGTDIRSIQKDIDLYNSGKCPTCKSDFNSEHFLNLLTLLIEKKESLSKIKLEIDENINQIRAKQDKLSDISKKANNSFNDITYFLRDCKQKIEKLQLKQSDKPQLPNIEEFEKSIKELDEKKSKSFDDSSICKNKEVYYKELNKIFGEDGVKKSIIAGIVKPINHFIKENIKKMEMPFEVELDETFTAEIKHLGNVIDHDSLSVGENKKLNISILIAYLMLIRTKKFLNVLFLDEVFSSIDAEGIERILNLIKSFANEYNINIFVVHHALLNQEMFDRIIKIEKNIFSSISEVAIND